MSHMVSMREARNRLPELARLAETGETATVTRNGTPVADLVPHNRKGGVDFKAGRRWLREQGYEPKDIVIADDFEDPLPEDFLITPQNWVDGC